MAPRPVGGSVSSRDLLLSGCAESVTDEGLLAVVMGGVDAAGRSILDTCVTPGNLWRMSAEEISCVPGIGPARTARVLACLEMSRRASGWRSDDRPVISTPEDVVQLCWPRLRGSHREHFWALPLSTRNHLLKLVEVSVGSLNASIVHPRELFKEAVRLSAASVVAVHNHPSGDPTPSGADIQLTRRLVKAGDVLGIELLDHVIIGDGGEHASLRDLGLM